MYSTRYKIHALPPPTSHPAYHQYQQCRCLKAWADTGRGAHGLYIYNIHGDPAARMCPQAKQDTNHLIHTLLEDAAQRADHPVLFAGDFNLEPDDMPIWDLALATEEYLDPHATCHPRAPTCWKSPQGSLIDHLYVNRKLQGMIAAAQQLQISFIRPRDALTCTLTAPNVPQKWQVLTLPPPLPDRGAPWTEEALQDMRQAVHDYRLSHTPTPGHQPLPPMGAAVRRN